MEPSSNTRRFGPPDVRQSRTLPEPSAENAFQQYLESPPTAASRTESRAPAGQATESPENMPANSPPNDETLATTAADASSSQASSERSDERDSQKSDDTPTAVPIPIIAPPVPAEGVVSSIVAPNQADAEQQPVEQVAEDTPEQIASPGDISLGEPLEIDDGSGDDLIDGRPNASHDMPATPEQQPKRVPIVKMATTESAEPIGDATGQTEFGKQTKREQTKRRTHPGKPSEPQVNRPTAPDQIAELSRSATQTVTGVTTDGESELNRSATESSAEKHLAAAKSSDTESGARIESPRGELSNRLFSRSSQKTQEQHSLTSAEQVRFVRRVARGLQTAADRNGPIQLRLRPSELGSIRLEITIDRGSLSARILTETHMARAALLDALPQLRDRLTEQGIRIEQFQVNVGGQGGQELPQQSRHGQLDELPHSGPQRPRLEEKQSVHAASTNRLTVSPGKLNVIV